MEKFIIQLRKQKIANKRHDGYWRKILSQEYYIWGGRLRDGVKITWKKRWEELGRKGGWG